MTLQFLANLSKPFFETRSVGRRQHVHFDDKEYAAILFRRFGEERTSWSDLSCSR